jgi:hypothetical protein
MMSFRKSVVSFIVLSLSSSISIVNAWTLKQAPIMTRWASQVNPSTVLPEYPRPQLVRSEWRNLNGVWQFQSGAAGDAVPIGKALSGDILVPFPVESAISGVMHHYDRVWYRRTFTVPAGWSGERVLLHFGAVDYESEVYVNGKSQGIHKGGYDPFTYDITASLTATGDQELIVRVYDPTDNGGQPRGKQTLYPGGIMYTPCSGIWQSVWLEPVPQTSIASLKIVPDIDNASVKLTVNTSGSGTGLTVQASVKDGQNVVRTVTGAANTVLTIAISSPKLWSPSSPFLYDLSVSLLSNGAMSDSVGSYFGMRKISLGNDGGYKKMLLNNKFLYEIGPLDQGFWPDGIYTAPTDEALKFDLIADKTLGFNMVRKHIKVEPYRWYYWADKLGLLVWQDMPSPNSYTSTTPPPVDTAEFSSELTRMIQTHWNSPSIIMWDIFNEGQGEHDAVGLVKAVSALDPSRLVNEASGWEHFGSGAVNDVHSYPAPGCPTSTTQATACGEFGGIGYQINGHVWNNGGGYTNVTSAAAYLNLYQGFFEDLSYFAAFKGMSAAVYTQITDVETELNGILTYDRAVYKADTAQLRKAAENLYTKIMTITEVLPSSQKQAQTWRYTTATPAANWTATSFNDGGWSSGKGGFGTAGTPGAVIGTTWNSADIWLRRQFNPGSLSSTQLATLAFLVHHDEDCEIYINGVEAASATGYTSDYTFISLNQAGLKAVVTNGNNVLAVHCHQTTGGQYIDVGIVEKSLSDLPVGIAENRRATTPQRAGFIAVDPTGKISAQLPPSFSGGKVALSLFSPNGRLARNAVVNAAAGTYRLTYRFPDLTPGVYFVKIIFGGSGGAAAEELSGRFTTTGR